ncbi:MAG TPA: sigma-70 family RNA polymerase sigma factor [Acidimicrobiales bacterium]|jgi:RNA polymerase sigma-70 factor (ECF subfamily)|nr:sigma-70 family RNA polymerase sigma factor [Acidimicrobiales bacterium]
MPGVADDLTALALAARDGDRVALAAFVRASQAEVWRLCAHLTDRDAADDVTQDAYMRALSALRSFRGDSSARTWLLSIAHRACADHVRRVQRRRRLLGALHDRRPSAVAPALDGVVELDVLLSTLDPDRRTAFVLTQLLGLEYQDAAEVVDVPVGTIRSRVARARTQLIEQWGDASTALL